MQYRVTGQNLQTGARQTLEFEAASKAAAEKKAAAAGMTVNRVEEAGGVSPVDAPARSRRRTGGGGGLILLLLLMLLVAAAWYAWRHGMIPFLK
jgi:hypothetical protein